MMGVCGLTPNSCPPPVRAVVCVERLTLERLTTTGGAPPPPPGLYKREEGHSEHRRQHGGSCLAKARTTCSEFDDEQWLEVSVAGTSSSALLTI